MLCLSIIAQDANRLGHPMRTLEMRTTIIRTSGADRWLGSLLTQLVGPPVVDPAVNAIQAPMRIIPLNIITIHPIGITIHAIGG